ncbi:MAG: Zn-ribbon domain-containing OB-fold protein [Halobacteria archaeon]
MTEPRFWRYISERYRLTGTMCRNCGEAYLPPRQICPECRREGDVEKIEFSGEGEVISHTRIHEAGENYQGEIPYSLAIIELEEGARLTAQVVDNEVETGDRVEPCFRKVGEAGEKGMIHYGTKFELAND